jgi:aminoglycoside phosphotransferase (APT) family kinase protein
MHDDEIAVDVELVARLIAAQYPRWSGLALRPVEPWGTDNAIWRLGEDPVVRLPRIAWAKEQPAKEAKWLPILAPHLPVAIPEPVALGRPDRDLEGNCLVLNGKLSGLVDWGSACVGDPAVDVQVAWSPLFTDESRARFLDRLNASDATIERAKAMAIQQACAALPYYLHTYPLIVERSWKKLAALGVPTKVGKL